MKKISIYILTLILLVNCTDNLKDATDFTSVENPNLSEGSVVGQPNSSNIWLTGLERQLANAINEILILAELGSDNYVNTQTFFNQFMDGLEIRNDDPDMEDTYFAIARLREMARFGLNTVGPGDTEYNTEIEAEYNFFEGLAYLYSAMYFSNVPTEPGQPTTSSTENYNFAVASFNIALGLNPKPEYHLAKARAYYYLGNVSEASSAASAAIGLDPDFLRSANFDEQNGPDSTFDDALFERATFDDLQPLPSLDFLDPKYSFVSAAEDAPVHYLKAEEAYLILAEANLANTNATGAQTNLEDLLGVIATREVREIDDSIEGRPDASANSANFPDRPDNTAVVVNGRSGLVLDRQAGMIMVPSVSGTSLSQSEIDAIANDDAALALLYRTRQEVFIAEGIRLVDMGVKLVIHQNEFLQNININDGDLGTVKVVPSFIAAVESDLDSFTYTGNIATITIDLNQILVANKTASEVLPFH
jgi:tetratricopeptide (TPR) repeat protein